MSSAKQIRLKKRPVGLPRDDVWEQSQDAPRALQDGEIAIEVQYVSIDPAMRGWLNDVRSYVPPVGIGEVMRAGGVGLVTDSKSKKFAVGDTVLGTTGVQTHYVGTAQGFTRIMPELAPPPKFLGGLGMPGMTAYFGLLDVGQPKEGETVLVSGAAGAVGSVVGQIAKIKGCRVVGIAGGKEKCEMVVEKYGFDACIDYKNEDLAKALKAVCPDRIDIYFDNVGGQTLEHALNRIAMRGRILLCGAISQYNNEGDQRMVGPSNYMNLLVQRARMEGFVVFDYAARFPEAIMEMMGWMQEGKLHLDEHIVEGIDNFPEALRMLFDGRNKGKLVLKVQ
ncbi:MAG: NADP-dependent oxidoreductase [Gammaproteobacteria bacterium]|nr:NADP-dependent oxidoreductase [Gammaproteobacteria bacterium]